MLNSWFNSKFCQRIITRENLLLKDILPRLFGYYLLQIGCTNQDILVHSRIKKKIILNTCKYKVGCVSCSLYGRAEALPISTDMLDVAIISHVLEFADNPHLVLKEIERILIADGHVIIFGFNPFSIYGIRHKLLKYSKKPPWTGNFISLLRIKDWLALLGFEIVQQQTLFFSLPIKYNFTSLGDVYLIVAKKRQSILTPLKPSWNKPQLSENEGVIVGAKLKND
jgi:SAM-dependent methyltransferase